jgi:hypothetical protein
MTSCHAANSYRAPTRVCVALIVATLLQARPGLAEPVRESLSQTLFEQGRKLMEERRFSEACPKLAESQRLEPTAGALLNLALCHELQGKSATAWLEYHDAVALAAREGNPERRELAQQRIADIEPRLARLVVAVPSGAPTGIWAKLDGVPLAASSWGARLPIDPGRHRLEVGAPRRITRELSLDVTAQSEHQLTLPALAYAPLPSAPPATPGAHDTGDRAWSIAGGAGLGLALAGAVATTYFGLRARSSWQDRNELCQDVCEPGAASAGNDARDFARIANVTALVGLAGAATSAYAWWLRPALRGSVTRASAELSLRGQF